MKVRLQALVALSVAALVAPAVFAADSGTPDKKLTPQQQRMSDCAHQSKGMKGDEHKKFMSDCLKGKAPEAAPPGKTADKAPPAKPEPPAKTADKMPPAKPEPPAKTDDPKTAKGSAQQEKMKTCNAEAGKKGLKGDERKTFMATCLKG